eukprot:11917154-Alexandrium_andersonii.AAC.1
MVGTSRGPSATRRVCQSSSSALVRTRLLRSHALAACDGKQLLRRGAGLTATRSQQLHQRL